MIEPNIVRKVCKILYLWKQNEKHENLLLKQTLLDVASSESWYWTNFPWNYIEVKPCICANVSRSLPNLESKVIISLGIQFNQAFFLLPFSNKNYSYSTLIRKLPIVDFYHIYWKHMKQVEYWSTVVTSIRFWISVLSRLISYFHALQHCFFKTCFRGDSPPPGFSTSPPKELVSTPLLLIRILEYIYNSTF